MHGLVLKGSSGWFWKRAQVDFESAQNLDHSSTIWSSDSSLVFPWEMEPTKLLPSFDCYPQVNSLNFTHQVGLFLWGASFSNLVCCFVLAPLLPPTCESCCYRGVSPLVYIWELIPCYLKSLWMLFIGFRLCCLTCSVFVGRYGDI